jgi:hypothetical protein
MDHESSIKTQAAERYLLGELPPAERDAFEEHFFACPECADEVRLGMQFSENARAVFRQEPAAVRPVRRNRLFAWLRPAILVPVAAAAMGVVAFTVYQNAVEIPSLRARIGHLEQPRVLVATVLMPSSRSAVRTISLPSTTPYLELALAIAAIPPAGRYECQLRSETGKVLATISVPKLDPDSNLQVLFPANDLTNGYYDAVLVGINGGSGKDLDRYRFSLRRD